MLWIKRVIIGLGCAIELSAVTLWLLPMMLWGATAILTLLPLWAITGHVDSMQVVIISSIIAFVLLWVGGIVAARDTGRF